jgi:magnesium chelatase family protein
MLVKTKGSAIVGIDAVTITIEVNVSMGQGYCIVGLPDNAVKESLDRTESAIKSNGFHMPRTKLVINLSPADLRKSGAAFDLPIAIGILAASEQITQPSNIEKYLCMGELGLDGNLYPIKGILAMAMQAKEEGFAAMIIPKQNAAEALMVDGIPIFAFSTLQEVVYFLNNPYDEKENRPLQNKTTLSHNIQTIGISNFADIKGQSEAKRALEIASAGGHNLIMIGPPGAGKTLLSKSIVSILPPLNKNEALETSKIYSVSGKIPLDKQLISQRPFRQPHHTLSAIAMIGGGGHPQPGEISLAHNGVLFLDELPEFNKSVIEVLRQPMEAGLVSIARAKMTVNFPARFMLLAAMNPCPCGYYNHPQKPCHCSSSQILKYLHKISSPLLDRIDLHIEVTPVPYHDLIKSENAENSIDIAKRVELARAIQLDRFKNEPGIYTNAQMNESLLKKWGNLTPPADKILELAMGKFQFSARAYDRIRKLGRTIADLDANTRIKEEHISEAIQYRNLDRSTWGQFKN